MIHDITLPFGMTAPAAAPGGSPPSGGTPSGAQAGPGYLCWDGEDEAVLSKYLAACRAADAPAVFIHAVGHAVGHEVGYDAGGQINVVADFTHLPVRALLADELPDPPSLQTGWRYLLRALPAIDPAWDDEDAWTVHLFGHAVHLSTGRRSLAPLLAGELYQRLRVLDGWVRQYAEIVKG